MSSSTIPTVLGKRESGEKLTAAEFLQVWSHYDKDNSGSLEYTEIANFMKDLLLKSKSAASMTTEDILQYTHSIIELIEKFDLNKDGSLEMSELELLLGVKENKLRHSNVNVNMILDLYDEDRNGLIKGSELKELCADVIRREGYKGTYKTVEEFEQYLLKACDKNKDHHLDREELQLLIELAFDR